MEEDVPGYLTSVVSDDTSAASTGTGSAGDKNSAEDPAAQAAQILVTGKVSATGIQRILGFVTGSAALPALEAKVTFINTQHLGVLSFTKQVKYNESNETAGMQGQSFGVFTDPECTMPLKDLKGQIITGVSDKNGKVIVEVPATEPDVTYYVKELTSEYSNVKQDESVYLAHFTNQSFYGLKDSEGNAISDNTLVNDIYRASFGMVKTDQEAPEVTLSGSTYGLFRRRGLIRMLLSGNSVDAGTDISSDETDGFNTDAREIIPSAYQSLEGTRLAGLSAMAAAYRATGALTGDADTDRILKMMAEENLELVATGVTGPQGELGFDNLVPGQEYVLKELIAPKGYSVSEKPVSLSFVTDSDGTMTQHLKTSDGDTTAEVLPDGKIIWHEPREIKPDDPDVKPDDPDVNPGDDQPSEPDKPAPMPYQPDNHGTESVDPVLPQTLQDRIALENEKHSIPQVPEKTPADSVDGNSLLTNQINGIAGTDPEYVPSASAESAGNVQGGARGGSTGDESWMSAWAVIFGLAAAAMAVFVLTRIRTGNHSN